MNDSGTHIALVMEGWGKGGTETYVSALAGVLSKHGISCHLVLLRGDYKAAEKDCGLQTQTVSGYFGLLKYLQRERPRLLNLHLYSSLLPVTLMARLLGIRTVATLHMPPSAWGLRHRFYWRLAMRLSDKVVGVSRRVVEEIGPRNRYPRPLPGGVANGFFDCERKPRESGGCFRIAAVGRLSVEKDWPTLIESVAQLPADVCARTVVDFYGSGPLQPELEALAARRGVQTVFHGHVDRAALVSALAVSDLAVLPSRFEGLGLSALECMAAGVPTITSDFPAASEFIEHGVTGHIFPMGNASALAQLVVWHVESPAASEAIAHAGRKYGRQHFSEEIAYLPYLDLFTTRATRMDFR